VYSHWLRARHIGLAAEAAEDGHPGWRASQGRYRTSFASRWPRGNRRCRSALAHGFIAGLGVVGPIAGDLPDLTGNLRQQRREHPAIMNVACGTLNSHHLFRLLVNSSMKFAPKTPSAAPMLVDVPLPCSINPKTGGINDHVMQPTAG